MSRDRFTTIMRFLHPTDNSMQVSREDPNYDKLFKLGNLHKILNNRFSSLYSPQRSLSIDKQMIRTKCQVSFLQYMPKKLKMLGVKVWALCESLSGYCCQFQKYTGKIDGASEHGLSYRVVFDLMSQYLDKGYHLYFDNFYTRLKLVKDLLSRNIFPCGTIRINRGEFPNKFKNAVKLLLNSKLIKINFNNQNTGGEDKCNQYLSYYSVGIKTHKWWKTAFFRLFEMCVINSMCIYIKQNPEFAKKRNSHKIYREVLVHQLAIFGREKYEFNRIKRKKTITKR